MRVRRLFFGTAALLCLAVLVVGSLAGSAGAKWLRVRQAAGSPSTGKLAQVLARGTLLLAIDPAYPPQSYRVKGARRPATTRCAANQLTGSQMAGYDADTSKLVAKGLGVEPCF